MDSSKMNYAEVSSLAQMLKFQIRTGEKWDDLKPASKEALDQIATLIARIASSDEANWEDIIAHAQAAKQVISPVKPSAVVDIERDIRRLAREIPQRNGDA